jgi:hypothetical protein
MIERLSRHEILKLNATLAAFIVDIQDVHYNPMQDYPRYEAGDMHVEGVMRYVSQAEADTWNEADLIEYNNNKDIIDTIPTHEGFKGSAIYNFPKADIDTYIQSLSKGIVAICTQLHWESVIFLLEYTTPWLYQKNNYPPVKKALKYLKNIGVDAQFNGGFKANGDDLIEFSSHLFWLMRCNAALPHCYFSGIHKDVILSVCKEGNIHVEFYSDKIKQEIEVLAATLGMEKITNCYSNYTETGVIKGRQTIL